MEEEKAEDDMAYDVEENVASGGIVGCCCRSPRGEQKNINHKRRKTLYDPPKQIDRL